MALMRVQMIKGRLRGLPQMVLLHMPMGLVPLPMPYISGSLQRQQRPRYGSEREQLLMPRT